MGKREIPRFCPICEEMVPDGIRGVTVRVLPSRTVFLHIGCVEKILKAYRALEEEFEGEAKSRILLNKSEI